MEDSKPADSKPGRIVVGIARSLGGYQAIRYGVAEARRRGATLLAVRTYWSATNGQGLLQTDVLTRVAIAQVNIAFMEALGGMPTDLRVEVVVREGAAARTLVSTADRESDLLIIGGYGIHRLAPWRTAAVARFCARRATCPVVIVPPTALARSAHADRLARDTARDVEDYLTHEGPRRPNSD